MDADLPPVVRPPFKFLHADIVNVRPHLLNESATSPSAGIHAVNAIVTDGLNRDQIEPLRPAS